MKKNFNPIEIENWIKTIPKEIVDEANIKHLEEVKLQYQDFEHKFKNGDCYMCNSSLSSFDINKPCLHWLLRPKGCDKEHFKLIFRNFDYCQIDAYLRWVANQEGIFKNINDLSDQKSETKIIETTIKYKNFEWSFSCSKTDLEGHDSEYINFPHYHLQMRIDNKPFIDYSDFHIKFSDKDLFTLMIKRGQVNGAIHIDLFASGMETALNSEYSEELLKQLKKTDDESKAAVNLLSFAESKQGETISGDAIADIFEESKRTGVPIANLLHKLNANVKTIISPSDSVPQIAKRTARRKSKK